MAQGESSLIIHTPETEAFPSIRFQLDAYDSEGAFIEPVRPEDLQVLEDGQMRAAQSVQPVQTGVEIILAVNINPAMLAVVNGKPEYQNMLSPVVDWASAQPAGTLDDFSFSTPTGLYLIRETDPNLLAKAITEYQIEPGRAQPSLGSLAEALDLANDPLDGATMKRSILYITPPLPNVDQSNLPSLIDRATKIGVAVNVWQIGGAQTADVTTNDPLQNLATETKGRYHLVNLTGPYPEIDSLFEPLRKSYQVEYQSGIQKSGSHHLVVHLQQSGQEFTSDPAPFKLDVKPPNPIFLSPPSTVQRTWRLDGQDKVPALAPAVVPLKIMIEFPDQHPRDILATRLYADGKLVAENTAAPFDQFDWSIANVDASTTQSLRVEVVDSLKLSGTSIDTPVALVVDQPAQTTLVQHPSRNGLIAVGAAVISGLTLTMILMGTRRRFSKSKSKQGNHRKNDPLSQPVFIQQDEVYSRSAVQSTSSLSQWSHADGQKAPARLVSLDEHEQPVTGGIILLTRPETTFGADPQRATEVLSSATVSNLHARLYRDSDHHFILADQGSTAGTWVNYAPVNSHGACLEHGDLIHIGKVMFRFELADPNQIPSRMIKVAHLD